MEEEIRLSAGEGRYRIHLLAMVTPDGVNVMIYGGEKHHVGGMALSVPRPSGGDRKFTCDTWITPRPGHKDDQAAALVSRQVCLETGQAVAVVAGIHIKKAQPEEIEMLMKNCQEAASRLGQKMKEIMQN